MLSAGSVCKQTGERDAEERFGKKEKVSILRFRGKGVGAVSFLLLAGMKLKGGEEIRAISILFVRASSYTVWIFNLE